jgi:hypothetical protein
MKIDLVRCDVCGTVYNLSNNLHMDIRISKKKHTGKKSESVGIDICPLCKDEIINWLEDMKDGRSED